jgi:hypothetical protein
MGLLVFSMLDRAWSFGFLYQPNVDLSALQRQTARAVEAIVRGLNDTD